MSHLRHPHIARLHGFFRDGGAYHMVLDLCRGGNLGAVIKSYRTAPDRGPSNRGPGGIPTNLVAGYILQMLDGLTFLHEACFIHRDIKPDNYLLEAQDPRSPLKLIDFGYACQVDPSAKLTRVVGSSSYAAPELLRGSYGLSSDVWSLGVTCCAACTDSLPFCGATDREYFGN